MARYTVVPAGLEADRKTIIDVWRRNLSFEGDAEAKYDWQFLENPYGSGRCWLLLADGVPVGASAASMRLFEVGGRPVCAAVAGDFAVDKPHRFLLPALMLQRAVMSCAGKSVRLVYGTPNARAAAVMQRASYADAASLHRYAKVLQLSRYLERAAAVPRLASALGGAADLAYGTLLRLSERLQKGYVGRVMANFDSRFDKLWERARTAHPVIAIRDSRFLGWRFARCPLTAYRTVALLSEDESRLHGYWTYYLRGNEMVCADLLADEDRAGLDSLLAAVSGHARDIGAASISAPSLLLPEPALAAFRRFGFRRRTAAKAPGEKARLPEPRRLMVHYAADSGAAPEGAWYFTPADEDND